MPLSSIVSARSGSVNKFRKSKLRSVFSGSKSISSSHKEFEILVASTLLTLGGSLIFNTFVTVIAVLGVTLLDP